MPNLMLKKLLFTVLSLMALSANSVLCRLALIGTTAEGGGTGLDPVSFTLLRLSAGIVMLWLLIVILRFKSTKTQGNNPQFGGSYKAAFMLFVYAFSFSVAYLDLGTGAGALILFGAVQLTMIFAGWLQGHKLYVVEWAGVGLAFAGFIYLVLPGFSTPSFSGFILMTVAGVAWGIYTLMGRESQSPVLDTASNFLRTWPWLLLLLAWLFVQGIDWNQEGVLLAVLSGAITSGLGYVIWYATLPFYTSIQAAVLQLLVPVIASLGGVVFVAEAITMTLVIASLMILGGIFLVIAGRWYLLTKRLR